MEIEQYAQSWINETMDLLDSRFPEDIVKDDLVNAVNNSVTFVMSYAKSIFRILVSGEDLPAMALLRSLYELMSRVTWILMGLDDSGRRHRLERLEKTSLKDRLKFIGEIRDVFGNDKRESTIEALKEFDKESVEIEERIDELHSRNVKKIPQTIQILEIVFKDIYGQPEDGPDTSGTIPISAWSRLNKAVHPDYTILKSTITNSTGRPLYDGKVNEDADGLRYECCVCIHRFFKEIYSFYDFDFEKIDKEFLELTNRIVNSNNS